MKLNKQGAGFKQEISNNYGQFADGRFNCVGEFSGMFHQWSVWLCRWIFQKLSQMVSFIVSVNLPKTITDGQCYCVGEFSKNFRPWSVWLCRWIFRKVSPVVFFVNTGKISNNFLFMFTVSSVNFARLSFHCDHRDNDAKKLLVCSNLQLSVAMPRTKRETPREQTF